MGMKAPNPPERYDDEDGRPVEEIRPKGSRFEWIEVKRFNDRVELRAELKEREEIIELNCSFRDELYRGLENESGEARDVDDDLRDALNLVGFSVVSTDSKEF